MEKIIPEIDAGLVELCAANAPAWIPPWIVLYRKLWPWEIWDPMVRLVEPLARPVLQRVLGERESAP
jgi:hypothetical protein